MDFPWICPMIFDFFGGGFIGAHDLGGVVRTIIFSAHPGAIFWKEKSKFGRRKRRVLIFGRKKRNFVTFGEEKRRLLILGAEEKKNDV